MSESFSATPTAIPNNGNFLRQVPARNCHALYGIPSKSFTSNISKEEKFIKQLEHLNILRKKSLQLRDTLLSTNSKYIEYEEAVLDKLTSERDSNLREILRVMMLGARENFNEDDTLFQLIRDLILGFSDFIITNTIDSENELLIGAFLASMITIGAAGRPIVIQGDVNFEGDTNLEIIDAFAGISLINKGTGPDFKLKTLITGDNITLGINPEAISVSVADDIVQYSGTGNTLLKPGSSPKYILKGLVSGTGITMITSNNSITVNNSSVIGDVLTFGESIISDGTPGSYKLKKLSAGTNVSLSSNASNITISSTNPGITLDSMGDGVPLLYSYPVTGQYLYLRSIKAGSGINVYPDGSGSSVVVETTITGSTYTISGTGFGGSLVQDGTSTNFKLYDISASHGMGISNDGQKFDFSNTSYLGTAGGFYSWIYNPDANDFQVKGFNVESGIGINDYGTHYGIYLVIPEVLRMLEPLIDKKINERLGNK